MATKEACRWAATSVTLRPEGHQICWCARCAMPTAPIWTGFRLSRAGWTRTARHRSGIYDVAVSDGRPIGPDGRNLTPVGNTVNVEAATYTNAIGDPYLTAYWEDPDFDPSERAFYYVRVIEIPTPRWTTYDARFFGTEIPDGAPASIQDRAYTSPIWYTPAD